MKKIILFSLAAFSLFTQEPELPSSESLWDFHPIHVGGTAIAIGKANVDLKDSSRVGNLTFNKANAFAYMLLPINRSNFFFPRVEWNSFTLDWDQNPKFNQTQFHFVQFALTFFSIAIEDWRWISRIDYNIDAEHFSQAKTYGLFSALLWGTHQFAPNWNYHIGSVGYTGYEGSTVYPIIGFDYTLNKRWFFQCIFPINYSIEYIINNQWRVSAKGRPLKERFRTGANEVQPRSIFSYSSMGAELNVKYEKFLQLEIEMYAGYNFGGSFYIKDKRGHNALYTHVQGAPYIGASLNWGI